MHPTAIWELLVGEFNPGTGMAAVHIGSDHHKACLKLSAWFQHNAPEWLVVFEDFCKQHAPGLCISPRCHCWNMLTPTYCMAKQMRKHSFWQTFVKGVRYSIEQTLNGHKRNEGLFGAQIRMTSSMLRRLWS